MIFCVMITVWLGKKNGFAFLIEREIGSDWKLYFGNN
jgi:hypothetical protein